MRIRLGLTKHIMRTSTVGDDSSSSSNSNSDRLQPGRIEQNPAAIGQDRGKLGYN
jgi:hypothetical protein